MITIWWTETNKPTGVTVSLMLFGELKLVKFMDEQQLFSESKLIKLIVDWSIMLEVL